MLSWYFTDQEQMHKGVFEMQPSLQRLILLQLYKAWRELWHLHVYEDGYKIHLWVLNQACMHIHMMHRAS